MAHAACSKCNARFPIIDGQPIICPGCGAKFKRPARKPEAALVGAPVTSADDMLPPSASRDDFPEITAPNPVVTTPAPPEPDIERLYSAPAAAPSPPQQIVVPAPNVVVHGGPSILARVVWLLFIAWVGIGVAGYVLVRAEQKEMSAIQEAALGVDFCAWLICGYVVSRAIDSLTRS